MGHFYIKISPCAYLCSRSQSCSTSSCHLSLFERSSPAPRWPLAGPLLAPRWPLAGPSQPLLAPDENHDWSSVGILKGPQLGVRGSACSSPFCMRASAGVLNPSSAQLPLKWRLDSPRRATCIICKREAEEERKNKEDERGNERTDCMNTSACERERRRNSGSFKFRRTMV